MTQMDTSENDTNSHSTTNFPSANAYNTFNETTYRDVNYNLLSHLSAAKCEDFLQNNSANYDLTRKTRQLITHQIYRFLHGPARYQAQPPQAHHNVGRVTRTTMTHASIVLLYGP